ncbi:MAG: hypothetical protein AAGA20_13370 [Planctomycetota bacterium]
MAPRSSPTLRVQLWFHVTLLLPLLGCGDSSSWPESYSRRLALDPASEEFDALMDVYEEKIFGGDEIVRRNLILEFQEFLESESVSRSERFLAAADAIFAVRKIEERITPRMAGNIAVLARREGHPAAREWIDGYRTDYRSGAGPLLARLGQLAARVPPTEDPGEELSRTAATLLDEFESFGVKLHDSTVRRFVEVAIRGRFPRMLEHLDVGMPASDQPFGAAAERTVEGQHPEHLGGTVALFDRFFDKEGNFLTERDRKPVGWAQYEPWLDVVRAHTTGRAAAAEGIALARFGIERDPVEVVQRLRSIPSDRLLALGYWSFESHEEEPAYLAGVKVLLELADLETQAGRSAMASWITDYVSSEGRQTGNDPLEGFEHLEDPVDAKRLEARLTTAVQLVESLGEDGGALARSGLDESAAWPMQYVAVSRRSDDEPEAVARSLNARIDASLQPNAGAARPPDRVLKEARLRLRDQPGAEVDEFFVRLLSMGRSADREGVVATCKERMGDQGLVDAVYRFMAGKSVYTAAEYSVFLETLSGLEDIEGSVLSNLEAMLDEDEDPAQILWILKVLSYDLLERHGTSRALPLLRRMGDDPTGYRSLVAETDPVTGLPQQTDSTQIAFAERVQALIDRLE